MIVYLNLEMNFYPYLWAETKIFIKETLVFPISDY